MTPKPYTTHCVGCDCGVEVWPGDLVRWADMFYNLDKLPIMAVLGWLDDEWVAIQGTTCLQHRLAWDLETLDGHPIKPPSK